MSSHPASVAAGDTIAIVSPSGPSDEALIRAGADRIAARYPVHVDERCFRRRGFLAGSDHERAGALLDALRDPKIRAVWCTRGGYGATRLLERVGPRIEAALRADPKPLIGFSDVTALHALWSLFGVRSIHGPMVSRIGTPEAISDDTLDAVFAAIEGRPRPIRAERFWAGRGFEGRAAGGNLAVLAALVGTPHAPSLGGRVVFLEDTGERPYRVDRMLTQLRAANHLAGVAGFVLGEFVDCLAGPDGTDIQEVLLEGLRPIGAPIVVGAPFGHGTRSEPIELDTHVRVHDDCTIEWPGERAIR